MGGNSGSMASPEAATHLRPSGYDPGRIGIGLLGVSILQEEFEAGGAAFLNAARLEEIERRILGIEAMVFPLGR